MFVANATALSGTELRTIAFGGPSPFSHGKTFPAADREVDQKLHFVITASGQHFPAVSFEHLASGNTGLVMVRWETDRVSTSLGKQAAAQNCPMRDACGGGDRFFGFTKGVCFRRTAKQVATFQREQRAHRGTLRTGIQKRFPTLYRRRQAENTIYLALTGTPGINRALTALTPALTAALTGTPIN